MFRLINAAFDAVVSFLTPTQYPPGTKTSRLAIFSLVLGLLSILFCVGGILAAIPGIICGHIGRAKIRQSKGAIVLDELDTVTEFVSYLKQKEQLLSHVREIKVLGEEEELLAMYLTNEKSFAKFYNCDLLMVDGDLWSTIQNNPHYKAKKAADVISYGWDSMIDRAHDGGTAQYEIIARELARPDP